mmetsp:Transcript_83561/g.147759  ORF Transcript_83561/g.147759 Transcript_83561/m.147759 type:complete len:202 (-) Transcript_83561:249-854(-)
MQGTEFRKGTIGCPKFVQVQKLSDVKCSSLRSADLSEIHVVEHHKHTSQDLLKDVCLADLSTCRLHSMQLSHESILLRLEVCCQHQGLEPLLEAAKACKGHQALLDVSEGRFVTGGSLQFCHEFWIWHNTCKTLQLVLVKWSWPQGLYGCDEGRAMQRQASEDYCTVFCRRVWQDCPWAAHRRLRPAARPVATGLMLVTLR